MGIRKKGDSVANRKTTSGDARSEPVRSGKGDEYFGTNTIFDAIEACEDGYFGKTEKNGSISAWGRGFAVPLRRAGSDVGPGAAETISPEKISEASTREGGRKILGGADESFREKLRREMRPSRGETWPSGGRGTRAAKSDHPTKVAGCFQEGARFPAEEKSRSRPCTLFGKR